MKSLIAAVKTSLVTGLLGLAVGLTFLLATPPAKADHYVFLFQGANYGQFELGSTHTWAFRPWAIENQTAYYCNALGDLGGVYVTGSQDAIADWESRFPWPWNEFTARCASGQKMDIVYRTGPWGTWPCGGGNACAVPTWSYDSARGGYYVSYFRIWFDNTLTPTWNYFGDLLPENRTTLNCSPPAF